MYTPILRSIPSGERHILLQMDLSSECNLNCIYCFRRSSPPHFAPVPLERVSILETQVFPFVQRLQLSIVGEPLTSLVLLEVLSAAKRAGVTSVGMTSNGLLMNRDISWNLLERGLDWLAVSVDASTQVTYENIRRGGDWTVLMENLAALDQLQAHSCRHMSVALNYVIMDHNADEAIDFPVLARSLGVDSITFHPLTIEREEMKAWSLFYTPARWNQIMQALRGEVARVGIPALVPDDLPETGLKDPEENPPVHPGHCSAVEDSRVFMTSDGNCYLCPNVVSEGSLGNVFETSFRDIWDSLKNQEFRERAMKMGQVQGCDYCKLFALHKAPECEAAYVSKHLAVEVR